MAKTHRDVPKDEDLKIPRWARIALLVRTVSRVGPLLLASWPTAPKKFVRAVDSAIAEAELASSQGAVTSDQTSAGMAAMAAYASRPMDVEVAGYIAYAAAHSSFAAREPKASSASFVIEQAMWAAYYFGSDVGAPRVRTSTLNAVWMDLGHLIALAKKEQWTAKTPVPPSVFGPMWPKGPPQQWPPLPKSPTLDKRRTAAVPFNVRKLGLPRDLAEFLRSGKTLVYDSTATECGSVALKPYAHLRPGRFFVTTDGTLVHPIDPHRDKRGHYIVDAIDLIGECDAYDPQGILAWFPALRCYGCWDIDHGTALVFPKAKWSDIVANPAKYIDAQWNGPSDIAEPMIPWRHSRFKARK